MDNVAYPAAHVVVLVRFGVVLTAERTGRHACIGSFHAHPEVIPELRLRPGTAQQECQQVSALFNQGS